MSNHLNVLEIFDQNLESRKILCIRNITSVQKSEFLWIAVLDDEFPRETPASSLPTSLSNHLKTPSKTSWWSAVTKYAFIKPGSDKFLQIYFRLGNFYNIPAQVSFNSCNLWRNTIFRCQRSVRYLQISLEVVVAQRRKIKVRRNQPEFKEDDSKSILQYICCDFCYI